MNTGRTAVVRIAISAINRKIDSAMMLWHKRLAFRVLITALLLAVIAGGGVYLHGTILSRVEAKWWQVGLAVSLLATAISLLTATMLYPLMRQGKGWAFKMASNLAGESIDRFLMIGKMTELRNRETAGHNLRVTYFTLKFVEELGLAPEVVACATKGALIHDIGKFAVPDRVLRKPGPLTTEERQEMEEHVPAGMALLNQSQYFGDAVKVVAYHHEHFDGMGYPHKLQGESIPLEARIFALIDVFDALTSARIYSSAVSIEEAIRIMSKGRGSHFDPILFDRFVDMAPKIARQVPANEEALLAKFADSFTPYAEFFVLGDKLLRQEDKKSDKGMFISRGTRGCLAAE